MKTSEDSNPPTPVRVPLWRKVLRSAALLVAILVAIAGGGAVWVMQPTGSGSPAKHRADPAALREQVRALTEDFGPRYQDLEENLAKCRGYLIAEFRRRGAETEEQVYRVGNREYRNVRAFFGDRKQPRVVVGAHYDTCDEGPDYVNRGADDNASGVAGLLGLAALLQQERPSGSAVELVAYCTEEPPYFATEHMGSYCHAEVLKSEGVAVKGVLVLEMIGYFSDEPGSQSYPAGLFELYYPSRGNFLSLVGGIEDRTLMAVAKRAMKGSAPLPVYSSCIPRSIDGVHLSDHMNYWPFGFTAVMVTDTSYYRNRNYHGAGDVWQTLDYERMAHAVTQVHQAVLKLGE